MSRRGTHKRALRGRYRRGVEGEGFGTGREEDRGRHTLEVRRGVIVGLDAQDVFVELGVRMQGVLPLASFGDAPRVGEEYDFTLRGQEDGLWALARVEDPSLPSWESLQVGALVPFHVLRRRHGGLEGKIGALHAFLPRSHSTKQREQELEELVGRLLTCEVLEVDAKRQRAVVSLRVARKRARESPRQREASGLKPGQVVQGRVSRVENYGVFLKFGAGLEGLIHVSNLSHGRVSDVAALFSTGDALEAKVLHVHRGGKRIALGLKQMQESPWQDFAQRATEGSLLEGQVVRSLDFGAFLQLEEGIEGLLPRSQMGLAHGEGPRHVAAVGRVLSVRILELDPIAERLTLSLLHADGARIAPEEASGRVDLAALARELGAAPPGSELGKLLARALKERWSASLK